MSGRIAARADHNGRPSGGMSRRGFLMATTGAAGVAGSTGVATAQAVPDFGAYLDDARLYDDDVTDLRGEDELTVDVGAGPEGLAFGPPTIWIDPGTTVNFEWTGEGGGHNVVPFEGPGGFEYEDIRADPGLHYEYEFTDEDAGITTYKCVPHEPQGMKGGIAVGDDVPTIDPAEGPAIEIPDRVLTFLVVALAAIGATLGLGYFFMKYGGDYET